MKKLLTSLFERLRYAWWSLTGTRRRHDMFLVHNMAYFNYGGGWRELLLNNQVQNP
ncbi:MAG TPA: hypothetical protein VE867_04395 [Candidatus Binatia bacterium]|jgi:hypothetical protein|nr:hypothetical protein [Candidatus Binatia bacterium]